MKKKLLFIWPVVFVFIACSSESTFNSDKVSAEIHELYSSKQLMKIINETESLEEENLLSLNARARFEIAKAYFFSVDRDIRYREKSLNQLQSIIHSYPMYLEARLFKARVLALGNDSREEALAELRTILSLQPDHSGALMLLYDITPSVEQKIKIKRILENHFQKLKGMLHE